MIPLDYDSRSTAVKWHPTEWLAVLSFLLLAVSLMLICAGYGRLDYRFVWEEGGAEYVRRHLPLRWVLITGGAGAVSAMIAIGLRWRNVVAWMAAALNAAWVAYWLREWLKD